MKPLLIRVLALCLVAFFSIGCAGKIPRGQTASAPFDAPQSGSIFFWRASKSGKPGTVFLLGSVHLRHDKSILDRAITDAARTCERGAFEIDFDALDNTELARFIQTHGMLQGTLRDVVTPETYAAWVKAAAARHLPREQLEKLQPWLLAMTLGVSALQGGVGDAAGGSATKGASMNEGIDKMLYAFEKTEPTRKRTIIGLETALEQLSPLANISSSEQDRMLREAATGAAKAGGSSQVVTLYESGNEAGLLKVIDTLHGQSELDQALIKRRNISMTEKIRAMFDEPGCTVVTVGAAHMLGSEGIVHRLVEKGFTVERVAPLGPTPADAMTFTVTAPKEFISEEAGFSVTSEVAPVKRQLPVLGSTEMARIFLFAQSATEIISITVRDIDPHLSSQQRSALIEKATNAGMAKMGLAITKTDTVPIQEENATRTSAIATGTGHARRGMNVSLVHGDRFYMLTALQLDDGDPKKLDDAFAKIVESFRFR